MKIAIKDARVLHAALGVVTSGNHTVTTKLANGEFSTAQIPFKLEDKGRWNLIKNLAITDSIVKAADKFRDDLRSEIAGGPGKNPSATPRADAEGKPLPSAQEEFIERLTAHEDEVESRPFLKVKRTHLKESNDNPVPGYVVVGLLPILDDDTAAADKADIIPD